MTEPSKAVFLSYASQDAGAARRICESLRAAGLEVWFDQSDLRGGDVWDHRIRQQIQDCALFIPVISAHTDERTEGYFRLEWKLAVDRSYLMADDAAFLFPVVIDETTDASARVPERFRAVQWTRLPAGEAPPAFGQRVAELLAGTAQPVRLRSTLIPPLSARATKRGALLTTLGVLLIGALALYGWRNLMRAPPAPAPNVAAAPASRIPENSIAVLPFEDMSAGKDQGYISDGLAEELLNLLSKVPGMQVAARTSAFSFKGHAVDIPTIGRQLMVAHVLEGSVLRVGNHLRVTAQLERADNGYQIWSETYDRELGDVFRVQDEIAAAVVKSLKVSLLGAAAPRNLGTQNSEAYLVFLQGRAKMATQRIADTKQAAADFERALKLDPNFSPAYVELATAKIQLAEYEFTENRQEAANAAVEESKLLIERALALDPENAQAYIERGYLRAFTDNAGAERDLRRGVELNPSSARGYARLAELLFLDPTRWDEALAMLTKARQLDPLDPQYDELMALYLEWGRSNIKQSEAILTNLVAHYPTYQTGLMRLADARRTEGKFAEAIMLGEQALKLDPSSEWTRTLLIWNYIDVNDLVAARQVVDEAPDRLPIHGIQFFIIDRDWHRAAEIAYAAWANETVTPANEALAVYAIRMEARQTHVYARALGVVEKMCGVSWSPTGLPSVPHQTGFGYACVATGDLLIASGERARGERLLRASLADMDYLSHDLRRGDMWFFQDRATALALLGEQKAALAALHKAVVGNYINTWELIAVDPAFDSLRAVPEFQAMMREIEAKRVLERQNLDRLRAAGSVPVRSGGANPAKLLP